MPAPPNFEHTAELT